MAINWYPGHMHKANKEMAKLLPNVDLVVELLDARIPYSSQNPAIAKLAANKPCIKILSKSDLADPMKTSSWHAHFEQESSVKTLLTTLEQPDKKQRLTHLCHKLVPNRASSAANIIAMILGIPNVGKSTLINAMAGRKIAKTGNEPAVTKAQQRIKIDGGITLLDTPGILWPKIHNENSGYRLAATGAIKDTAISIEDIAFYLSNFLLQQYPNALSERYHLSSLPGNEIEFLEVLGARRGCLRAGGQVDLEKVSSILINEYRSGQLGPITLETPQMVMQEEKIVQALLAKKSEKDNKRKQKFRRARNSQE